MKIFIFWKSAVSLTPKLRWWDQVLGQRQVCKFSLFAVAVCTWQLYANCFWWLPESEKAPTREQGSEGGRASSSWGGGGVSKADTLPFNGVNKVLNICNKRPWLSKVLKTARLLMKKYRKAVRWCASLIRSLYWLIRLIRIGFFRFMSCLDWPCLFDSSKYLMKSATMRHFDSRVIYLNLRNQFKSIKSINKDCGSD